MSDLPRHQLVGLLVVGAIVVVLGALWVRGGGSASGAAGGEEARAGKSGSGGAVRVDQGGGGRLVIHVAGAVRRPGIYRLSAGARVAAAVRRAGGATRRADLDALNLAARLTDGRQVLVPARAAAGGTDAGGAAVGEGGAPLNLNSATAEQLDELEGIGPGTAAKILEYRQEHGGFGSVDELDAVPGIGPARLEALRDQVTG